MHGIQLGTGATTGKGNLVPTVADAPPFASFLAKSGRRLTLRLRSGVVERIRETIAARGVGPAGLWAYSAPPDALFEVAGEP